MTRVVLASASPARRQVLRSSGIDPVVIVSGVDEDAVVAALPKDCGPGEVATALARAKAAAVVELLDPGLRADCVVIGCDSMLFRDGRLWGKPATEADALQGWHAMAGNSGQLYTGHCLIRLLDGDVLAEVAEYAATTVHFGSPSAEDLAAYAGSGEPTTVAGGFTLDGLGGWFVERIDGDPSNVIGISLPLTRRLFEQFDLRVSRFW